MSVLVVVAHPDDEVLGCGGTLAKYALAARDVAVLMFTDGVSARDHATQEDRDRRAGEANRALAALGVQDVRMLGMLDDNALDRRPLIELVRYIERAVAEYRPVTVLTHTPHDPNIDHVMVSRAVATACRPASDVRELLYFEVPSATEWAAPPCFAPQYFIDITGHGIDAKVEALEAYASELRDWPHPRSVAGVTALAQVRGMACGVAFAEAFEVGRIRA